MKHIVRYTALTLCVLTANFSLASGQAADAVAPESGSGIESKRALSAHSFILASANPLATRAGYDILKAGGSAVDAMVAVQAVLGLVEPQSSGLGGGAFALYYDAASNRITTYDGRETAPLNARPELFLDAQGAPLKFFDAVVGGRSVGTPGTVKLMQHMHDKHGVKLWKGLFTQAQGLASDGFRVSPRLASSIARDQQRLRSREDTLRYFFDRQGAPLQAGSTLKNPAYAHTLERLANEGSSAFYTGSIGADIVAKVQSDAQNPGVLSTEDLALYKVIERPAVCAPYLDYSVCGMGPPSSGALSVGQILGISSHFDLKQLGPENSTSWQIIGDASRLAFADRARYMADSDYVPMPQGLLDPDYLAARADLITPGAALSASAVSAGEPNWGQKKQIAYADDVSLELPSTSHFVIVDSQGNVLSMTTTIENGFGSRLMSNGFLLNNELTDFSFKTHSDGYPIANRLEPGKRPRSSMAPSIVMRDAKPVLAIGSPGGSRIIGYVANSLISLLTWELPLQEALNAPHLINRFGTYDLEANSNAENLQRELEQMGFNTKIRDLNSGLHAVQITPQGLVGAADPRREGTVMGE